MEHAKHVVIVAGETSGDHHAAALVKEIKKLSGDIYFSGLGGPQMQAAGVDLYEDLTRYAVIGFWEVFKHLSVFRNLFHLVLEKIQQSNIDAVILVDYPGFNLRLAKKLKKQGIKVIYYISPQIWAWKENRIRLIKKTIDKMIVFFPFEKTFYARHGMNVFCCGHPLLDHIAVQTPKEKFLRSAGLKENCLTLGLLPGSRDREVRTLLPLMVKAYQLLQKENLEIQCIVIKAPSVAPDAYQNLPSPSFSPMYYEGPAHDAINACDACLVASGTATLETALLKKPMVIVYRTSLLTWILAKWLVKIPYIGLVNVAAGKKVVPECIQFGATPLKISQEISSFLLSQEKKTSMIKALDHVQFSLGPAGANKRAAKEIIDFLETNKKIKGETLKDFPCGEEACPSR